MNSIHWVKDGGDYSNREINNLPKLVLLDLKLPKVNGREVLRSLKSDERTKHIPVVVLTSSLIDTPAACCGELRWDLIESAIFKCNGGHNG